MRKVASFGLRGEVLFAVPCVLAANPCLLGYCRLLLGLSQKEFYGKGPFGRFKRLEDEGLIPERAAALVRRIAEPQGPEGRRFREMLCSTIGIPL